MISDEEHNSEARNAEGRISRKRRNEKFLEGENIDLGLLGVLLWQGKWWILGICIVFGIVAAGYALSLPNIYQSKGIYASSEKETGIGSFAGQYGSLAAIAGLNIGGTETSIVEQALALVKSRPFLESVIRKYELKSLILGVREWDRATDNLVWDDKIYNHSQKIWLGEATLEGSFEPTDFQAYVVFSAMIDVSRDSKTGLISIAVQYYSPNVAALWVELLVQELNQHFQRRDVSEAKKGIEFLEMKISETGVSEMQAVFYRMIESQTKTMMLAQVREEYLLKTVVAPVPAEIQSSPARKAIVIFGGGFGVVFSILYLLFFHWRGRT